jgi:1-acyl-sn-glycerol-3-phosphate acyltransferase
MLPALIGWIVHAPLFYSCKLFAELFKKTGHYDSLLTSTLLLLYPIYFLVLIVIAFSFDWWMGLAAIIVLPFSAWAGTQAKYQMDL